MSNDIQKARDVLAKWRQHLVREDWLELLIAANAWGGLTRLIVGTAGNPNLLDAIDSLLATAQREDLRALGLGPLLYDAERIAAAILAADELMGA